MTPKNRLGQRKLTTKICQLFLVCAVVVLEFVPLSAQVTLAARDGTNREPTTSAIKLQTSAHLRALQTISATEKVLDQAYSVAFYENRQQTDSPPHFHGPTFKSAWFELLRESLFWYYEAAGDHFTFKDRCAWMEKGRVIVPCSGQIFNKNLNVSAIIVRYETKRWGTVELRVDYDFVTLSEPRLVAKTGYLRWGDHETKVAWADYRELRATEPIVKEWVDEEVGGRSKGTVAEDVRRRPANDGQADGTRRADTTNQDLNLRGGEAQITPIPKAQEIHLENLLTLPSDSQVKTVRLKKWWRKLLP